MGLAFGTRLREMVSICPSLALYDDPIPAEIISGAQTSSANETLPD